MFMAVKPGEAQRLINMLTIIHPNDFVILLPTTELIGGSFKVMPEP
ncbi:hypothetical protein [Clostridium botulinum]|nr:hypothetical protein [Clostridium botulinum]